MAGEKIRKRNKIDIDSHSYLETFPEQGIMDVVIFIHGIFGNHEETWSDTPTQLIAFPSFANADLGSFGYDTSYIDFSKPEKIADQLNLWMRTHLMGYKRIYIIAHSMGGLIIRQACTRLLTSDRLDDKELYNKLCHCFLVAVPLSGSWAARLLNRIPLLSKINKKLPFLAKPDLAGADLSNSYRDALKIADQKNLSKPAFSIFVGTNDIIVAKPESWAICPGDSYEGPVPGTHSDIKTDKNANSTLVTRIVQIITTCMQKPPPAIPPAVKSLKPEKNSRKTIPPTSESIANHKPAVKAVTNANHYRDIILISCSASKSEDGAKNFLQQDTLLDETGDPQTYESMIELRKKIKDLIESGRLTGDEFDEGNRAYRQQNRKLIKGPDFGGLLNEEVYLPGYRRYCGRFYQATRDEWEQFYAKAPFQRPAIFVVSGLYGLFSANQLIQNYDCHLSDLDKKTGKTISMYWQEVLTNILIARVQKIENEGFQIGTIYDFLCEKIYQDIFDWQTIKHNWPVRRLQFENMTGRETLDNSGMLLREIIKKPAQLANYTDDQYHQNNSFAVQDDFIFGTI